MRLDFSALAQPAPISRGQVGTTGTDNAMPACVSPTVQPGAGTAGDKSAARAPFFELAVASHVACPPVSPASPQEAEVEKLNVGAVSPMSPLVPVKAGQVALVVPFERDRLVDERADTVARSCGDCEHLLQRGTCAEPVAAGLLTAQEGSGIVWPPDGHDVTCGAFTGKAQPVAAHRPHRLRSEEVERCHAPSWDHAEIATFTARAERFALLGLDNADDLAERLTLRDRDGDDRRLCLECTWLGETGRCAAAAAGRLHGADRRFEPVQTVLQRCTAFRLRQGLD